MLELTDAGVGMPVDASPEWSLREEYEAKAIGWLNLTELGDSALITHTEVPLVRALALDQKGRNNGRK
ncbi:hypothetical protein [uncultured Corynebacterium sp.]|uniref:hypothetical protein n=1 Tax=uncultured Corynebacterium sp. TaxID=159447 RepID=UPI0025D36373|nr:hypothetical protein [uncultured Corynebacterium sp.]